MELTPELLVLFRNLLRSMRDLCLTNRYIGLSPSIQYFKKQQSLRHVSSSPLLGLKCQYTDFISSG